MAVVVVGKDRGRHGLEIMIHISSIREDRGPRVVFIHQVWIILRDAQGSDHPCCSMQGAVELEEGARQPSLQVVIGELIEPHKTEQLNVLIDQKRRIKLKKVL